MMKGILRRAAIMGVSGAMVIAAMGSSSAEEVKKHKTQTQTQDSATPAPATQAATAPPPLPGYISGNPCVLDDGYGRFQPCAGFN